MRIKIIDKLQNSIKHLITYYSVKVTFFEQIL